MSITGDHAATIKKNTEIRFAKNKKILVLNLVKKGYSFFPLYIPIFYFLFDEMLYFKYKRRCYSYTDEIYADWITGLQFIVSMQ